MLVLDVELKDLWENGVAHRVKRDAFAVFRRVAANIVLTTVGDCTTLCLCLGGRTKCDLQQLQRR